jgi:hypothetical protein
MTLPYIKSLFRPFLSREGGRPCHDLDARVQGNDIHFERRIGLFVDNTGDPFVSFDHLNPITLFVHEITSSEFCKKSFLSGTDSFFPKVLRLSHPLSFSELGLDLLKSREKGFFSGCEGSRLRVTSARKKRDFSLYPVNQGSQIDRAVYSSP